MNEHKKRLALVVCIILSIIPAILFVRFPNLISLKTLALYASAILGYAGIVVLLWSYMLGAKSISGLVFRDIAPVLSIHKWLGKWGTIAIFLHPLLIMYSYGESLLYTVIPDATTRFESHVTLGRLSFIIVLIIWATSALLRSRIKFRPWRYIHLLGYIALPFAFLHVPDVGSQFMSVQTIKIYYFGLVVIFAVFTLLRIRGLLALDKTSYRIVAHRQLTSGERPAWLLQLRPVDEHIAPAKGQYIYIKDGLISEDHPFSVLDYNSDSGDILVTYRAIGRFTQELTKRTVGSTLLLGGPFGSFTHEIEEENKPVVFVAGGIGIAPMLRHLQEKPAREQWLFYANQTKDTAVIIPELRRIIGNRLVTIFSRQTQDLEPLDEQGHLSGELFLRYLEQPSNYRYYLCGSDKMMQDIAAELASIGVSKDAIRREAFTW